MKTKSILTFVIIIFSQILYAAGHHKFRLLYNSNQINKPGADTLQIKNIHAALFSDLLVVKLQNKNKMVLKPETIWGYQDEKGTYYRYWEHKFYKIVQLDTLIIYSLRDPGFAGFTSNIDYYFSKTNDSKIVSMSRKNLKKEFSTNICFIEKLDTCLKWNKGYLSIDTPEASYIIVTLYKQCKT